MQGASVGKVPWRRAWQPTPVFLPGESHGQRSLVGYSPWVHKDSDMIDWSNLAHVLHTSALSSATRQEWKMHLLETRELGFFCGWKTFASLQFHQVQSNNFSGILSLAPTCQEDLLLLGGDTLVGKVQCLLHHPPGTLFVLGISISFQIIVLQVVFVLLFKNMFTNIREHVSFHSRNCANANYNWPSRQCLCLERKKEI